MGAAILMREYLGMTNVKKVPSEPVKNTFICALKISARYGLYGHGYESESGMLKALDIFRLGGLRNFLDTLPELCPEFHSLIWEWIDITDARIMRSGHVHGMWGEEYTDMCKTTIAAIKPQSRLYCAYGSNMSSSQLLERCPDAIRIGSAVIEDWKLSFHYKADIEPSAGSKTPAVLWQISEEDEKKLDRREGFPKHYIKKNIIINMDGKCVSVMVYVMTEWKKTHADNAYDKPCEEYLETIRAGYREAGFDENTL